MGGRSSSSTSSKQTTTNKTLNASASDIDNGSVVMNSGDNATITSTDYGAINVARDIAFESLEVSSQAVQNLALSQAGSNATIERVALSATTGGQAVVADSLVKVFRPFVLALLALAVVAVFYMMYRGGKRV